MVLDDKSGLTTSSARELKDVLLTADAMHLELITAIMVKMWE